MKTGDRNIYVKDPIGMARVIAMTTPGVDSSDTEYQAADKAIKHLRTLIRRRSLLAHAFYLMGHRSRAHQTIRALRKELNRAG